MVLQKRKSEVAERERAREAEKRHKYKLESERLGIPVHELEALDKGGAPLETATSLEEDEWEVKEEAPEQEAKTIVVNKRYDVCLSSSSNCAQPPSSTGIRRPLVRDTLEAWMGNKAPDTSDMKLDVFKSFIGIRSTWEKLFHRPTEFQVHHCCIESHFAQFGIVFSLP